MWPAGEVLFGNGVVDAKVYKELFLPIIRSVELVFGSSRSTGWGPKQSREYRALALQIGLGYQRHLGPTKCSISVFNNHFIASDSYTYGHPHNVWCFAGERIVRYYKSIPHNQKNFEATMSRSIARREATRFWRSRFYNYCTVDPDDVQAIVEQAALDNIPAPDGEELEIMGAELKNDDAEEIAPQEDAAAQEGQEPVKSLKLIVVSGWSSSPEIQLRITDV